MNIALAFPGCHRRAGVERIMWECSRFLESRGHQVTVFANEWDDTNSGSIAHRFVPMWRQPYFLRGYSFYRNCGRLYQASDFDVLNTHGSVCPLGGVHWVQSVQKAWLETSARFRKPLSVARLRQRVNPLHPVLLHLEKEHFGKRGYRKIIATTPQVKSDLMRLYGVPDQDVVIIPNGFSPTEFSPELRAARRQESRASLGLENRDIALLFVANELERKGYYTILSAMQILHDHRLRLLVVGRTDQQTVQRAASRFGLSNQVRYCGSTSDIAGYHAASDLFVLPTQYEAFCLAILEALGSGLPVITSSVPGAGDAIQAGVNGAVVDDPTSAECLARIIQPFLDFEYRQDISGQVPGSVVSYQWPAVLANYEQVLVDNCTGIGVK